MAKQKRAKDNKTHLDNLARDFEKEWEAFCKSFEKIEAEFMTMEEFREPQERPYKARAVQVHIRSRTPSEPRENTLILP